MGNENNESAASASASEEEEVTIDVDRFLRIGNRTKGGPDRAARIVCRKEEEEEEEDTQRAAPDLGSPMTTTTRTTYEEPARRVPVAADVDVLVVGGGCAGIAAAAAAKKANESLSVLLIEKEEYLGGTISRVGMESVSWWQYNDAAVSHGLVAEIEDMAKDMRATTTFPYNEGMNLTSEPFKRVADAFVTKYGVRCLFATWVVDTIVEGGAIRGVFVENVGGRQVVLAKRVIDCSGNADVLHRAGGRFTVLPSDQRMGITQVFSVSNVDTDKFLAYTEKKAATYNDWGNDGGNEDCDTEWKQETNEAEGQLRTPYLEKEFAEAEKEGDLPANSNVSGSWSTLTNDGELLNLNLVHMRGDALDPWQMSKMAQTGREKVTEALVTLRRHVPGCEDAKLRTFSNNLGVRDSRKCLGRYNLTGRDVLGCARFDDSVCVLPQIVDGYGVLVLGSEGGEVEVPLGAFRCDLDNLMVAGRCFAGDHVSQCCTRNIKCCMLTGQSAGVIAAASLGAAKSVWEVSAEAVVRETLRLGLRCRA